MIIIGASADQKRVGLWLIAWILVSLAIYRFWPQTFSEDLPAEIPILLWSLFAGEHFFKTLLPRPPRSVTLIIVGSAIAATAIISGIILMIPLGQHQKGTELSAAAFSLMGFMLGLATRWLRFILPTRPFQTWGDSEPWEDIIRRDDLVGGNITGDLQSLRGEITSFGFTQHGNQLVNVSIDYATPDGSHQMLNFETKDSYVISNKPEEVLAFVPNVGYLSLKPSG